MNDLQKSSKPIEFKATPAMKVFIDTAIRLMSDNVAEITREAGIDESNYYKWRDLEGFNEWFRAEWDRRLNGVGWKLDVIGIKNAKRDHKYWQDMQRRVGNIKDTPNSLVQVNNFSEQRKKELEEFK